MGDCSHLLDLVPDQEKNVLLVKVVNLEKQLWKCVQSAGLMSIEAQRLYKEACSCFEKLVLCEMEFKEIQDVEYSLWKLHYKHIDEFRRRIRQKGTNAVGSPRPPKPPNGANGRQNGSNYNEGFKLFLSEATRFYQDLLIKVRRRYGFLDEKSSLVVRSEATIRKCQFMCHRFLICIGDLARYKELHDNNDVRTRNWSVAATYYMKATVIWPDGGNSQNQLALLATYVGDEFLALFHCIRSLAVKEPFPDAWNNLMLLLEKNQSIFLHSVSPEVCFDFSNPSARTRLRKNNEKSSSKKTELWPLFIRLTGFFLTKSRSEDFPCTLGATVAELEALMELDDVELRASLESYQHMGTSRTGPFKALHIVCAFIFVIKHLSKALKQAVLESQNVTEQLELMRLSLVSAFVCVRCLVHRCLRSSPVVSCPLLPGVLVFLEWLVAEIEELDAHCGDGKVLKARWYFFEGVVKLLNVIYRTNWMNHKTSIVTALWEDFELQGFVPLSEAQALLNFSDQIENRKIVENGQDCRVARICKAAVKIARRTSSSKQWICYNPSVESRPFSMPERLVTETEVPQLRGAGDESEGSSCTLMEPSEPEPASSPDENSDVVDEEEVILFKPIVRHNSAPIPKCPDKDSANSVSNDGQQAAVDECLRRSKSLLITETQLNSAPLDTLDSKSNTATPDLTPMFSDFKPDLPLRKPDTSKEALPSSRPFPEIINPIGRGPPSLNAWVLEQGTPSTDRPKDLDSICKSYLKPIEVAPGRSLSPLKVTSSPDPFITSSHYSPISPRFSNAALSPPSTPRLHLGTPRPLDNGSDTSSEYLGSPRMKYEDEYTPSPTKASGLLSPRAMASPGKHLPLSGMLSSSEWLRLYREKQSLKQPQATGTKLPTRSLTPPRTFPSPDPSTIELYDRWGNPVVSVPSMNLPVPPPFSGLGRLPRINDNDPYREHFSPKAFGLVNEVEDPEDEPRPVLQYLKERELLRMQQKQLARGPPAYMGASVAGSARTS